jgi:hypothetical protein
MDTQRVRAAMESAFARDLEDGTVEIRVDQVRSFLGSHLAGTAFYAQASDTYSSTTTASQSSGRRTSSACSSLSGTAHPSSNLMLQLFL